MGDLGSIPGSRRSPGGGNGNPLQYSYLENPMDRGAWHASVHRIGKSWTRPKRLSLQAETWLSLLVGNGVLLASSGCVSTFYIARGGPSQPRDIQLTVPLELRWRHAAPGEGRPCLVVSIAIKNVFPFVSKILILGLPWQSRG